MLCRCIWLAVALVAGGCAPTFDWRDVAVPGTPLHAQLPCRPGRFERQVVVAGAPVALFMLSCEAGDVTFGVASAEVGDPQRVEPVLEGLANAARHALRDVQGDTVAFDLPGATPFSGNASAHLRARRPDGVLIEESLRVFARGTRVYQAVAIGPELPDSAVAPFEAGLRFDLERPDSGPS